MALDVIAGYDSEDPDTRLIATGGYSKIASEDFRLPPRLAFVPTPVWNKADAETHEAFEGLAEELGEACFKFDLPDRYAAAWDASA